MSSVYATKRSDTFDKGFLTTVILQKAAARHVEDGEQPEAADNGLPVKHKNAAAVMNLGSLS